MTLPLAKSAAPGGRLSTLLHAALFMLGFSAVFVVGWGGSATLLGQVFGAYKSILAKVGWLVVILFGLATLDVLKVPWFYYDTRPEWRARRSGGLATSALMGVFFAAGWTPCIGATLGAILTLGFVQETAGQAMLLSGFYALGMGVPFLALAVGLDRAAGFVSRFRRYMRPVQVASGLFLILIGVMILTNQITLIALWAQRNGLFLDLPADASGAPTALIALLAGLLSFLSPCVLPLVPAYIGYLSGQAFGGRE